MLRRSKVALASGLLGTFLFAIPAFADVAPDDFCAAVDVGKPCDNAGPAADQPGTCASATCTRATAQGEMSYDCYRCEPGSGGASGDAGASGTTTKPSSSTHHSGCSVTAGPLAGGLGRGLLPLVALGIAFWRRRLSRRG